MNFKNLIAPPEIIPLPGTKAYLLYYPSENPDCNNAVLVVSDPAGMGSSENYDQFQISLENFCLNFEQDVEEKLLREYKRRKQEFERRRGIKSKEITIDVVSENPESSPEPITNCNVYLLVFPNEGVKTVNSENDLVWVLQNTVRIMVYNHNLATCICVGMPCKVLADVLVLLSKVHIPIIGINPKSVYEEFEKPPFYGEFSYFYTRSEEFLNQEQQEEIKKLIKGYVTT